MDHSLFIRQLSHAELSALKLDGEVSPEKVMWDAPQNWLTRSEQILGTERHPLVLTGLSAVWGLVGGLNEPRTHTASTISASRIRVPHNPDVVIEERTLRSNEYWKSNKVGVTTPLRTITDVLRMDGLEELHALCAARSVLIHFPIDTNIIRNEISNMTSVPNKRLALTRFEKLDS